MVPVQDKEQQEDGSEQSHAAAVPFAAFVAHSNCIPFLSFRTVGKFEHVTLDDVEEDSCK